MGLRRGSVLAWAIENLVEIGIALAIAAGIVVLLYGVRALALRACKRLGPQHPLAEVLLDTARKTRLWFMVALAVQLVQGYLHPPRDVGGTITFLFTVAAAFQAAIWARALVIGLIEARTGHDEEESRALASAFGIIRLLVSIAVFGIAGVVVLDNLGVNVTGLVAGLGIGGIAIGLAAQGIFADLFAALSIIFDKPFRVGDTITYQGKEGPITGTVKQIGLKSTRILSLSGELRIIGNTQLLAQEVTNFAGRQMFRFSLVVGVIYQTDPALLAEIPKLMEAEVDKAGHRFVRAAFRTFSPSSIDFDFLFEVDSGDPVETHAAQEKIAFGLVRTFKERGIEFAYPTQTTFTAAPDGTMIMPYASVAPVVVKG
ncbi:MAG TPA: mechanosensitive ion channel domain-containing protein [Croceibacterium sp.]|nr:mechanosensitive ion channel domain-containing protein [Croceibacterium sp.]